MKWLSLFFLCVSYSAMAATEFSHQIVYTNDLKPGQSYQFNLYNEHTVRQQVEKCYTIPGQMICDVIANRPICHYEPAQQFCDMVWAQIADQKFHNSYTVSYEPRKDPAKVEFYLNQDGQLKIQVTDWMTQQEAPFNIEILDSSSKVEGMDIYNTMKFILKFQ